MKKKKIINVREVLLKGALVTTIIISGLALNNKLEQINRNTELVASLITQTSQSEISASRNYFVIDENKEKEYKAGDIKVIKVYDPIEGKEVYYYVKYCDYNSLAYGPEKYLKIFSNTPLKEEIENYSTKNYNEYHFYESILDDNITYSNTVFSSTSATNRGYASVECLNIGNEMTYFNETTSINEDEKASCITYAVDRNDTVYSDESDTLMYNIKMESYANMFGYNVGDIVTESELQARLEELNTSKAR